MSILESLLAMAIVAAAAASSLQILLQVKHCQHNLLNTTQHTLSLTIPAGGKQGDVYHKEIHHRLSS
jgi:hypothetical protein